MQGQFFGQSLSQRQSQQQKLSQVMIQSIGLLADSTDELREKIYAEVEKNPALEIVRDSQRIDLPRTSDEQSDNFQSFLENTSSNGDTLKDHLLSQLGEVKLSSREEEIARTIIQNLDDKGYHIIPLRTLFPTSSQYAIALKMLKLIQDFDPIGVAVENFQESLYVQAKDKNADEFTLNFIKYHLQLLETIRLPLIQKKLLETGISATEQQIEDVIAFIRTLNPFPASDFATAGISVAGEGARFISPDIKIEKIDESGESGRAKFYAELIKTNLPEIHLNESYLEVEGKQAKENIIAAKNFINSIEKRNETLQKVANLIVDVQSDFFEKGEEFLHPLKMKDAAEKIEVHESTISRIAHRKYLLCDRGTFELRYFFSSAAYENNSNEAVKAILERIIAENDAKNPKKKLSDQKLSQLLAERGIKIARRTVAKYRSQLNLQSSYDR